MLQLGAVKCTLHIYTQSSYSISGNEDTQMDETIQLDEKTSGKWSCSTLHMQQPYSTHMHAHKYICMWILMFHMPCILLYDINYKRNQLCAQEYVL